MKKSFLWGCLTLLAVALGAAPASASTIYTVATGGLDTGFLCTNGFGCGNGSETLVWDPPVGNVDPATGTITLDTTNSLADINLVVASSTFLDDGGPDNGIDEVIFTNVTYAGTGLTLSGGPTTFTISGDITISGTYEQLLAGANVDGPEAFVQTAKVSVGLCTLVGDNLTCGFDFGPGKTNLPIGDPTPQNRKLLHTFNVVAVVPEPGTALLMVLGLAGLATRRRR